MNYTIEQLLDICHNNFVYIDGQLVSKRYNKPVGSRLKTGYLNIPLKVNNVVRNFTVHRLVFLMHHGYLPDFVDHINGVRDDNRIENLRPATRSDNNRNRGPNKTSKSGVKGVSPSTRTNKPWVVHIRVDGTDKHVGYFNTIEEAAAAYQQAAEQLHGDFAYHKRGEPLAGAKG